MSKGTAKPVKKPKRRGESSPPVAANQDKAPTNAGLKTIEWLFREQLRVDAEWSVKFSNGFTWWADHHAQTIEIVDSETDGSGDTAYLIGIRTDLLRNFSLTNPALAPNQFIVDVLRLNGWPRVQRKSGNAQPLLARQGA
jgi:hypothetical protein